MPGLSVIIITKNEAHNIRACLESAKWADEIIVVDSGSTDDTAAISREYTPHVYLHEWPGFGMQKNRALSYASKDWVFSIDADERVTPELRSEIESAMRDTRVQGFEIPRLSSFCGRYIQHSGWYPDYVTRLFQRHAGQFSNDLVHERVIINGKMGRLKHSLLHESFRDLDQLLAKMNHYSSAGAEMLKHKGREATLTQAILHGLWAFFRTYVLRAGFLDGSEGLMLAVSTAEGTYYRYAKRVVMQRKLSEDLIHIVEPTLMTAAGHCHSFNLSLFTASTGERPFKLWMNKRAALSYDFKHVEMRKYFYRTLRRLQSYFLYRKLLKTKNKLLISTAVRTDMMLLNWAALGTIPPNKVYLFIHWFRSTTRKLQHLQRLAASQPNLVILAPTPTIATIFKDAGFADARVVPYPITANKSVGTTANKEFRYLLYAGAARQDKGFKQVVDLIEYLHQQNSHIPITIQTSAEHFGKYDAETRADIARLKSIPYPHLTLKTDVLSENEYEKLFAGAIAIQLYHTKDFQDRISGITLDAFSAGCPVISNANTWIARMVDRFDAGVVIDNESPQAIVKSAAAIIADYANYNSNAGHAGQILQQENSAATLYKVLTE